jgi:hypothetical protein
VALLRGMELIKAVNAWTYGRHPNLIRYFFRRIGKLPNVADPKTFHEKMLWRKIFDHDPRFVDYCDKIATKSRFTTRCPDLPVAKLLWSGENPSDIPAELLDRPVIVKASHGCDFNYWVEPGTVDRTALEQTLRSWLANRYGHRHGEWGYSQVRPRLLVEERLGAASDEPMIDFTSWSFGGKVVIYRVIMNEKLPDERTSIYDDNGNKLNVRRLKPGGKDKPPLPADFSFPVPASILGSYVERLAGDCDFMRVDFMWADGSLYGCEMTVYPGSGYGRFVDTWVTDAFASRWDLKRSWFLSNPQPGWRGAYADALTEILMRRAG